MKVVELLPFSQMLHGTPGGMLGNLQPAHNWSQQFPALMQVLSLSLHPTEFDPH